MVCIIVGNTIAYCNSEQNTILDALHKFHLGLKTLATVNEVSFSPTIQNLYEVVVQPHPLILPYADMQVGQIFS